MNKLFYRYIIKSIVNVLTFIGINLLLALLLFSLIKLNTRDTDSDILYISSQLSAHNGTIMLTPDGSNYLNKKQLFCMVLNDSGDILWEQNLPQSLHRHYTITDVAKFSRWYLEDHSVLVQASSLGLIILGYPSDDILGISVSKLYYVYDSSFVISTIIGISILLLCNVFLLLFLSWKNTRKVEHAITPILDSIEQISDGHIVALPEKGYLKQVYRSLNLTSKALEQKEEARAAWINGVSHDIRTPLSLILGYAGEMEEDDSLPDEARHQASIISAQSIRIKQLVEDLNLVSRLEYTMQPLNLGTLDFNEVIRMTVSDLYNHGLSEAYDIDLELSDDYLEMNGDVSLLNRMLFNLLNNSIVHNPSGAAITLKSEQSNHQIHLQIKDSGTGLSPEQLDLFNQGTTSSCSYDSGGRTAHGVGMKIVLGVVEAHHGSIVFTPNAPSGLCIDLTLPKTMK